MSELSKGEWPVGKYPPPTPKVPVERRPPSEWDGERGSGDGPPPSPPKTDEWPVRKAKEGREG